RDQNQPANAGRQLTDDACVISRTLVIGAAYKHFEVSTVTCVLKVAGDRAVFRPANVWHQQSDDVARVGLSGVGSRLGADERTSARPALDNTPGGKNLQ